MENIPIHIEFNVISKKKRRIELSPNSKVFELNLRTRVQFESSLSFTDWFQKDSKSKLHWKKYDRISSKIVKILFLFSQNQQKNPFRIRVDNKLLEIKLENLNQRPSLRWNSIIFISPSLSLSISMNKKSSELTIYL